MKTSHLLFLRSGWSFTKKTQLSLTSNSRLPVWAQTSLRKENWNESTLISQQSYRLRLMLKWLSSYTAYCSKQWDINSGKTYRIWKKKWMSKSCQLTTSETYTKIYRSSSMKYVKLSLNKWLAKLWPINYSWENSCRKLIVHMVNQQLMDLTLCKLFRRYLKNIQTYSIRCQKGSSKKGFKCVQLKYELN